MWSLDFHPTANGGALLASCSADKTLKVWDADNGELKATLAGSHTRTVRSVVWNPNSAGVERLSLLSGSFDGTAVIW